MRAMLVVFSDLDGTLLDRASYSFESARPALRALREKQRPARRCAAARRAPRWSRSRRELGLDGPFVVENGGAIVVPASRR